MNIFKAISYVGPRKQASPESKKILNAVELSILTAAVVIVLLRWFYKFMIWPDSTYYLTAAMNLVKHGTMFSYTNWPSATFQPMIEPYTVYPPGFPIYLSFFLRIFSDPLVGAAIGQSVALIALFVLIYRVTVVLDIIPTIRIATLLVYMIFKSYTELQTSLLTEAVFISLSLGVFLCAIELWEKPSRKIFALALFLIFCSGSVRWNGFANGALLLLPIWKYRSNWLAKLFLAGICGVLPNLLWFARNRILYGSATRLYSIDGIAWEKVLVPFKWTLMRWGFGSVFVLLLISAIALSPLFFRKLREQLNMANYFLVIIGMISQFFGIYILTLLVNVNPIDDRYLAPTYTFFTFLLFLSISTIIRTYEKLKFLIVLPWFLFALSLPAVIFAVKSRPITWIGTFTMPKEKALWEEIKNKPYFKKASHFYTDDNFVHQIFSEKPHRIVWTNIPKEKPGEIAALWAIGNNPFFIVAPNTPLLDYFLNKGGLTPGIKSESVAGFWVFYRD